VLTPRSIPAALAAATALASVPLAASAQVGGAYDLSWSTIDGGGATFSTGGVYSLGGTIGQPDAGALASGATACTGGFWAGVGSAPCYPNCDNSTIAPILNVADFACFLNRFAAGDPYANCDQSTTAPTLNVLDFACFLNAFAAGCP
jgi:hypothetical protein